MAVTAGIPFLVTALLGALSGERPPTADRMARAVLFALIDRLRRLDDAQLEALLVCSLSSELGAADTVKVPTRSVREWAAEHQPAGIDVVIIAVPVPEIQSEAMDILAPLGRLCLFAGWPRGTTGVPLDTNPIHYKSLVVTGTTGGAPRDYIASLKLIGSGRVDVKRIVSHVFAFADMKAAYDAAASGTALKVVIASQP
jgi:threonine dehydrogenase-like Zn-dependent dehydrogenase